LEAGRLEKITEDLQQAES